VTADPDQGALQLARRRAVAERFVTVVEREGEGERFVEAPVRGVGLGERAPHGRRHRLVKAPAGPVRFEPSLDLGQQFGARGRPPGARVRPRGAQQQRNAMSIAADELLAVVNGAPGREQATGPDDSRFGHR
jgi:hypothetical protein